MLVAEEAAAQLLRTAGRREESREPPQERTRLGLSLQKVHVELVLKAGRRKEEGGGAWREAPSGCPDQGQRWSEPRLSSQRGTVFWCVSSSPIIEPLAPGGAGAQSLLSSSSSSSDRLLLLKVAAGRPMESERGARPPEVSCT